MDVARNAVRGACALCSREGFLIRSHIIPRFLFKPWLNSPLGHPVFGLGLPRLRPGQPKEPLLCVSCEKKFSLGERYASLRLRKLNSLSLNPRAAGIRAEGLNYEVLKLFFLSVMWRASVASHPCSTGSGSDAMKWRCGTCSVHPTLGLRTVFPC